MNATIDRQGNVTIKFNTQGETLAAPDGHHYLPCSDGCGVLHTVQSNVVAICCEVTGQCAMCGADVTCNKTCCEDCRAEYEVEVLDAKI